MKKIRLIETFAGYGSQALALKRLGLDFEHYKLSEWNISSNISYSNLHNFNVVDCSKGKSFEQVKQYLIDKGLTLDDKNVVTDQVLSKRKEDWCRYIYNVSEAIHNIGNIKNVRGRDLDIKDIDDYIYMLTYSFPCVDLSTSGLQQGMKKGSNTRSGLLWEIERILKELIEEKQPLPQVLFMENVKQVVNKKNKPDFDEWCEFLESIGYTNTYKVVNSFDFGVAQNRERCYMISILGNIKYEFPTEKIGLTKYLRDYLDTDQTKIPKRLYIDNEYSNLAIKENKGKDFFKETTRFDEITVLGNYMKCGFESSRIVDINGICPTVKENHNTVTAVLYDDKVRKLTVREFGRLMGLTDEEIESILSVVSESIARKQFGNSIVVDVMVALFRQLFILFEE